MRNKNREELVFELLNEPWYVSLSDAELDVTYEREHITNNYRAYIKKGCDWWYSGYYVCVTISRPITLLNIKTYHTFKYQQLKIKPIKYYLRRPEVLRI